MADTYVYLIDMPPKISELVTPCECGYTIYINAKLSYTDRVKAYLHALDHIDRDDWDRDDVQQIEWESHK